MAATGKPAAPCSPTALALSRVRRTSVSDGGQMRCERCVVSRRVLRRHGLPTEVLTCPGHQQGASFPTLMGHKGSRRPGSTQVDELAATPCSACQVPVSICRPEANCLRPHLQLLGGLARLLDGECAAELAHGRACARPAAPGLHHGRQLRSLGYTAEGPRCGQRLPDFFLDDRGLSCKK